MCTGFYQCKVHFITFDQMDRLYKDNPHILIIPDSFKGSLTAEEVAHISYDVIQQIYPKAVCTLMPFSDGGEGALAVLKNSVNGQMTNCQTVNAIGERITAPYVVFEKGESAWIELSQASGLSQLSASQRNPLVTSTYGTGLQIRDALHKRCQNIYLGIGGSCTHDIGTGIFTALGGKLLDSKGKTVDPSGGNLTSISSVDSSDLNPMATQANWIIACDVENPLTGPMGAAHTYAGQKGANNAAIHTLEEGSVYFGNLLRKVLNADVFNIVGGGAAGGVSAGLHALLGSNIENGFDILSKITNLEIDIKKADLVITGEGCFDKQSMHGKLPYRIAKIAKQYGVLTYIITGQTQEKNLPEFPDLTIVQTKKDNMSVAEAMNRAEELLREKLMEVFTNLKL